MLSWEVKKAGSNGDLGVVPSPPRLKKTTKHLQYGPAAGSVRTQPEVPAMGFVAPPTVVFALRGVLP